MTRDLGRVGGMGPLKRVNGEGERQLRRFAKSNVGRILKGAGYLVSG